MATHVATVEWRRNEQVFVDRKYSREHVWRFDGGASVPGSSSPHTVRAPLSNPACVDPEEGLVAAVSSCHMLWFIDLACRRGFRIDAYVDPAEGRMAENAAGKAWVAEIALRPEVAFSGAIAPTDADVDSLHHEAHEECHIANSVRSTVTVTPSWTYHDEA